MNNTAEKETQAPDPWRLVYHETMDALIAVTDRRMEKHVRQFMIDVNDADSAAWLESARHESWQLLKNGLQHLKEWAPGRGPGSLAVAVKKASLRSSTIAASLGVPLLQMDEPARKTLLDPMGEALAASREMMKFLQQDAKDGAAAIKQAITEDKVLAIFGINNPELKKIFQSVADGKDMTPPDFVEPADLKKMERQLKTQLKTLTAAYNEASKVMQNAIFWLPLSPPKFGEKIKAPEI